MRPFLFCLLVTVFFPDLHAQGFHLIGEVYQDDNLIHRFGNGSNDAGAETPNFFIQLPAS